MRGSRPSIGQAPGKITYILEDAITKTSTSDCPSLSFADIYPAGPISDFGFGAASLLLSSKQNHYTILLLRPVYRRTKRFEMKNDIDTTQPSVNRRQSCRSTRSWLAAGVAALYLIWTVVCKYLCNLPSAQPLLLTVSPEAIQLEVSIRSCAAMLNRQLSQGPVLSG
jgi:hypothetical protein